MHTGEIEVSIARYFGTRTNLIVPNVFWGLGFPYEIDLLVVTPKKYAYEIEIKVSLSDLKADLKKKHQHYSEKIKRLYFAIPEELKDKALLLIPERAGLFIITKSFTHNGHLIRENVSLIKNPKQNNTARPLTDKEIFKLYELAAMRMWNLKTIIYNIQKNGNK